MPRRELARMRLTHLGKIMCNLSIIGMVILIITLLFDFLAVVLMEIVLFIIAAATLFLLLLSEEFRSLFANPEKLFGSTGLNEAFLAAAPVIFSVTAVFAILAIVLLATDKREKHTGRLVVSGISLGVSIVTLILVYLLGGGTL